MPEVDKPSPVVLAQSTASARTAISVESSPARAGAASPNNAGLSGSAQTLPGRIVSSVEDQKDHSRQVVKRREIFSGRAFDFVSEDVVLQPGAEPVQRDFVAHPGAVGVVALRQINGVEHVLLLSQYRHPVRARLWEIPAGLLDVAGERAVEAAQRELAEEAQLGAHRWEVLVDYFTTPGGNSEGIRVFLARDLYPVPLPAGFEQEAEEAEMETVWLPLQSAVELIHAGQLHNPSTVVGILACASALQQPGRLRQPEAPWLRWD